MKIRTAALASLLCCGIALAAFAQASNQPIKIALTDDKVGSEPVTFLPMVGDWAVVQDAGKKVLSVDGQQWLRGNAARGLTEKARAIYGSRYDQFMDNVKAFAYFPYTVAKDIDDFQNGEISMRYKLIGGQLDQCAGILFNLKSNGDYLTVRFNAKDHNVVLWTFNKGVRKFVKKGVEDVDVPMLTWNDLKIVVKGTQLQAYMNGKFYIDYKLPEPVSGKVGLWSKTDSASYFDDYTVILAGR
jgi:hypothetical protein